MYARDYSRVGEWRATWSLIQTALRIRTVSVYLMPKSGRYTDASIKLTEDDEFVCVLSVGAKFLYVIHGFDVLGVELRHIQVKGFSLR